MALTVESLLSRGFFPKELPPLFSSLSFGATIGQLPLTALPSAFTTDQPHQSELSKHVLVRSGTSSRQLGIPNPVHFYRLSKCIEQNWSSLESLLQISPFSKSRPIVSNVIGTRALEPEASLSDAVIKRAEERSRHQFLIKADVANFYPSIYTHAIPWAILTKSVAKSRFQNGTLAGHWSDDLDKRTRNTNSQQTIGIPIGPDTSLLIAELILGRVDARLKEECKFLKGYRFIDDYELVTMSMSHAEKALSTLKTLLAEYELKLNSSKTEIVALPHPLEVPWVSRLRVFNFRRPTVSNQRFDLVEYFNLVFELNLAHRNQNVIKYGVGRLKSVFIHEENFRLLEDLLAQCVVTEPACLKQAWSFLNWCRVRGHKIRKQLWKTILNGVLIRHLPLRHSSSCVWAVWMMKELGIKLNLSSQDAIANTDDCATALMGLWMAQLGLADASRLSNLSARYRSTSHLMGPNWLVCYEGNFQGWFGNGGRRRISNSPAFAVLESNNVSFLDKNASTPVQLPHRHFFGGGSGDD